MTKGMHEQTLTIIYIFYVKHSNRPQYYDGRKFPSSNEPLHSSA